MHFVEDVNEIRRRAERRIEEGAVTESYRGDKDKTIEILNEALATEIVCVLRYMHHYFMATGVHGKSVADEFKEHADAEREHADRIAERIQQLGGKPDYNPKSLLERSASQYIEGETLADMIREDLIAERIVIEVYQKMIRHFGDNDPTTRVMIEEILSDEEEHASDLSDLLYIVNPESGETEGEDPGANPLHKQESGNGRRQQRQESQRKQAQSNEPEEVLAELARERSEREPRQHHGQPQPQGRQNRGQQPRGQQSRPSGQRPPNFEPAFAGEARPGRVGGREQAKDEPNWNQGRRERGRRRRGGRGRGNRPQAA